MSTNTNSFAEKAYKHTKLDSAYTYNKIEQMLGELGIHDIRITKGKDTHTIEFIVRMYKDSHPSKVRINIPIPESVKDKNVLYRVLYNHLKNRFVTIVNGLKDFEEEFLSDLVILHDGKEQRLGDILAPKYKSQLKNSNVVILSIK